MSQHTNRTVLGVAPLSRTLPVVAVALVALFVFVKPEASAGLGFTGRAVFWLTHIGLGLAGILIASVLLRPVLLRSLPLAAAVLASGLAGAALLAPAYVLVERWLPAGIEEVPDDWLDRLALEGPLQGVLAEFIEVAPMYLAAWFVVNLPLLLSKPTLDAPQDDQSNGGDSPDGGADGEAESESPAEPDPVQSFYATLPRALGTDIVAVSSDMHYLHVHTSIGKCMVLGTLANASALLAEQGMLVHRSHWVAHRHVVRLVKRGAAWDCLLSNGVRVPVSRRKRAEVAAWFDGMSRDVASDG